MENIHAQILKSISDQFLILVRTIKTDNIRITDYARQLVEILDLYQPNSFSSQDNQLIQRWLLSFYNFLYQEGFVIKRFSNSNWHIYRLWVMTKISIIRKNTLAISFLRSKFHEYIDICLNDTGELIDFLHRDAISYQVYTLFAIIQTVELLEKDCKIALPDNTFKTLWSFDPSLRIRILSAVKFVIPYLNNEKTHVEFINSQIPSDKNNKAFGKSFDPKTANYLYRLLIKFNYI